MKALSQFRLFVALIALVSFAACNQSVKTNTKQEPLPADKATQLRNVKTTTAAATSYKTLATFRKGQADVALSTLANLQDKTIHLVVMYESGAPWANVFDSGDYAKTGDDKFNGVLASYNLVIAKHFELDELNEGLVLEPAAKLDNAVEAAREISMIDNILMVEVKEVPKEAVNNSSASN